MRCFDYDELKEYDNPGTIEFFRELGKKEAAKSVENLRKKWESKYLKKQEK